MTRWTQLRRTLTAGTLLAVGLLLAGSPGPARAGLILDPAGDILPTYTGVVLPGMDVMAHEVLLVGDRLVFFGRMAGPIAPTQESAGCTSSGWTAAGARPASSARQPRPSSGRTSCGTRSCASTRTAPAWSTTLAGVMTPLDPADIRINGDEFTASVPLGLLLPGATRPPQRVDLQPLAAQRHRAERAGVRPRPRRRQLAGAGRPRAGIADIVRDRHPRPARLRLAAKQAYGVQVVTPPGGRLRVVSPGPIRKGGPSRRTAGS